jgi:hypothetical protein
MRFFTGKGKRAGRVWGGFKLLVCRLLRQSSPAIATDARNFVAEPGAEEDCTVSSGVCMVMASEILRAPILKNEQCPGT